MFFKTGDSTMYIYNGSSWDAVGTGSVVTNPGGSSGQVQFNNSGTFGGDADLTFTASGSILSIGANDNSGQLRVHAGLITSGVDGGNGGALTIRPSTTSGNTGYQLYLTGGSAAQAGGGVTISGGPEASVGHGGGQVLISGGAGSGGSGYGGWVTIAGGSGNTDAGGVIIKSAGVQRLSINGNGSWTIGSANQTAGAPYTGTGTAGQVLTSSGNGGPPSWQDAPAGQTTWDASAIVSGTFANARISQTSVTQHQAALTLSASQITSGQFNNSLISQASVVQYQGNLSINENQISDGTILARLAADESVTGSWTFGNVVSGVTPVLNSHFATKEYVDNVAAGIYVHASVKAATTANISLTGIQTIDGVSLVAGDRVLVKNQTTGSQNGVYVVAAGAWSRAPDFDGSPSNEVSAGDFLFVEGGTSNGSTGWVLTTSGTINVGTTALTFSQMSSTANAVWGGITGTLGNQTDLQNALNAKADEVNPTLSGTINIGASTHFTGDFSNSSVTQRVYFQTNAGNSTSVCAHGGNTSTSASATWVAYGSSDFNNSTVAGIQSRNIATNNPNRIVFGQRASGVDQDPTLPFAFSGLSTGTVYATINPSGPSLSTDVITKSYHDTNIANKVDKAGDTMTGDLVLTSARVRSSGANLQVEAASSYNIIFNTNGAEKMRLTNGGSLQVGSTSGTNYGAYIHKSGAESALHVRQDSTGAIQTWNKSGSDVMTLDTNGNLGIGISPAEKLHVHGNLLRVSDGTFTGYFGKGSSAITGAAASDVALYAATGNLIFGTGTNTEQVRITSTGSFDFGKRYTESQTAQTAAASTTIDCSTSNNFVVTMAASVTTLTFINVPASSRVYSMTLILVQDATGGRTVTWPASVKWSNAVVPTLTTTPNKTDVITLVTYDGGTSWLGFTAGLNF
jgi:hypothetical protein